LRRFPFGWSRRQDVPPEPEELIRAELLGVERLEQHAESLAHEPTVPGGRGDHRLVTRLRENDEVLQRCHATISAASREERAITPAAEWLVDNFHVVEQQIREIRSALPDEYYRTLPKLAVGPLSGSPRVYGLAWAFVAHTDSRLDARGLERFVGAHQRIQPLTIGELWAVAITLRIVLVENLRRAAFGIVSRRRARRDANALADELLEGRGDGALAALAAAPLPTAFAVQLLHRLQHHDRVMTPALEWIRERLAAQGSSIDAIVQEEHRRQGATNVTVRNVITSMRLVSVIDWTEFFERTSLVDTALDVGGAFRAMDFPTRDHYRHAIEELARGSRHSELEIARRAVLAAGRAAAAPAEPADGSLADAAGRRRRQDPGHYLIGNGRRAFERDLGFRVPLRSWPTRARRALGIGGYLATVAFVTTAFAALLVASLVAVGTSVPLVCLVLAFALVPASDLAVALVNRRVARHLGPVAMPGLELRDGVPAELRTMVAVPTMLTGFAAIDEQIDRLEVHHLASPGDDLCFALLSDWSDADSERASGDDELLAAAQAGIERLNRRHGPAPSGVRFLLLHRRRVWSAGEGQWIGWERKRGKLHELDRWLRGAADTTFLEGAGSPAVPPGVRYVITLDADTRLPRGAARRLVGKMAHPLNRPSLDPVAGRVVEGHGVLQPRITPMLPLRGAGSPFQRASSGPSGLDPYAFAVSDVYQDLIGEGSYSGKGIYEIDAFEAALADRIPENAVLSHDLLEGTFARAGLVSDVELVEDPPHRYDVAAARQHRWIRGDWQLLPWIFGRGRDHSGVRARASIPFAGRWKLLDNLRRSLAAPGAFAALVVGWLAGGATAALVTTFVLLTIAIPPFLSVLAGLLPPRTGITLASHLRTLRADAGLALLQLFLAVTLLAHQALLSTDAIVRTLFRTWRRRRMLEWLTAAQANFRLPLTTLGFCRRMAGSLVATAIVGITLLATGSLHVAAALPLLVLWMCAPIVAQWASRSTTPSLDARLAPQDVQTLREIARRTWSFFDDFVGPEDHHLPPDNFQEEPAPVVAHRTSPTNIGLYLLSVTAARDFGWLGVTETVDRIGATLATVARLEHHRGHLYNWYDTRTLRPLEPKYVSTVDSGNFAGHSIAVGSATRELHDEPVIAPARFAGMADALALTRSALSESTDDRRTQGVTRDELVAALDAFAGSHALAPRTAAGAAAQAAELATRATTIADLAATFAVERGDRAGAEVLAWATAVRACVRSHAKDLDELLPWAALVDAAVRTMEAEPGTTIAGVLTRIPTVRELPERCDDALRLLAARDGAIANASAPAVVALQRALERSARTAREFARRLRELDRDLAARVDATQFGWLFDESRQLLSLGSHVAEDRTDASCYDLLASEARLASFLAIAKGDVPSKHWWRLGRGLRDVGGGAVLVSWSGSLFEYLMPSLVMQEPVGSLLDQTCRLVVREQIRHGERRGLPWGVSESAYNVRDVELTYQYSSFGVPGLGQKRGLGDDAVVAPYATALATTMAPRAAVDNFVRLAAAGASGRYGFHEALDYTTTRRPPGVDVVVVRAFMAHHQGMTLVAIGNVLHGGRTRARFHAAPMVRATELLLQERIPRDVTMVVVPPAEDGTRERVAGTVAPPTVRRFHTPHDVVPHTHLLSNARYAVMLTAAGSGYSRWRGLAVTRWREDVTRDPWGSYVFLRDVQTGHVWSAGHQPTGVDADSYEVTFAEGRAEIVRRDGSLQTTLEVVVSPENDAEVRRVSITNLGDEEREIDVTSYAEIVLAAPAADAAHPAFAKLFVQTEYVPGVGALLATRRPRSPTEPSVWAAHVTVVEGQAVGRTQYETDRARFLGRGRTVRAPIAVVDGRSLTDTVGTVLDPVFCLRHRLRIPPGTTARVAFWTMVATSRETVLDLADKHRERPDRVRTRGDPGLDPGPGATAPRRHRSRRSPPVPAPRQSRPVLRSEPASAVRRAAAECARAAVVVGPRDLRRPADRPRPHQRDGGPGDRPSARAGARLLATEAARGRRGRAQRTGEFVHPGPARSPRSAGANRSAAAAARRGRGQRPRVRAAHRPAPRGRAHDAAGGRARRARRPPRQPVRASAAPRGDPFAPGSPRAVSLVPCPRPGSAGSGAARRGVLERPRRLHRRRPRVHDATGGGTVHAGTVDQRDREPRLRLPGLGRGFGVHVVGQQPREPAHRVDERPDERRTRRSRLRPRSRQRLRVGTDRVAGTRSGRFVRGAARPGPQRVRAREPRHRAGPRAVRAAGGRDQGLAPATPQSFDTPSTTRGDGLRRMGSRDVAGGDRGARRHRDRSGDRGAVRAQPVAPGVRATHRVRGPRRSADGLDLRSHRVRRSQRRTRPTDGPAGQPAVGEARGRRTRSVRRAADRGRARARCGDRDPDPPRRSGEHRRRDRSRARVPNGGPGSRAVVGRRPLGRSARRRADRDAGSRDGRAGQSMAPLPDDRMPDLGAVRLLPGRRRVRLPRSAAGRHGAGARAPDAHAGTPAARRRAPVRGRRRAALVAPPLRSRGAHPDRRRRPVAGARDRALRRRHGGRGDPRRRRAVPRGRLAARRRSRVVLPAFGQR